MEAVLVMAMVGTIAAVAVPRYATSVQRYRAEGAARRISAEMTDAAMRARTLGVQQALHFKRADAYVVSLNTAHATALRTIDLSGEPYRVSVAASRFGADHVLIFDAGGAPDSAGAVVVQSGTERWSVQIDAEGVITTLPHQGALGMPAPGALD